MATTTPTLMSFAYDLLYALEAFGFASVRVDTTWQTPRSAWAGKWAEEWAEARNPKRTGPRKRVWTALLVDAKGYPLGA